MNPINASWITRLFNGAELERLNTQAQMHESARLAADANERRARRAHAAPRREPCPTAHRVHAP